MEETLRDAPAADSWRESLAKSIDDQRRRAGERVSSQRDKLRELESRIAAQLAAAEEELSRTQAEAREAAAAADRQRALSEQRQAELDQRERQREQHDKQNQQREQTLEQREQQLAQREQKLEQRSGQFDERDERHRQHDETLRQRDEELRQRQKQLDELAANLSQRQAELAQGQTQLAAAGQAQERQATALQKQQAVQEQRDRELSERQAGLERLLQDSNDQQQLLAQREHQTLRQRRHIAGELRARKQQLAAELELHRAEMAASGAGQDLQLQLKLSELQGKYDRLREELDAHQQQEAGAASRLGELQIQLETRQVELQHQQARLAESKTREAELVAERQRLTGESENWQNERQRLEAELRKQLDESRRQAEAARDDLARRAAVAEQQAGDLARLAAEKTEIERRLTETEQYAQEQDRQLELRTAEAQQLQEQLAEHRAEPLAAASGQDADDLRRRFEMAVQDVRELKSKNAELVEQLAKSKQGVGATAATAVAAQGWESLKQKLLADLETDFDDGDNHQKADKLTVQGAIKITDEVVADKDREIDELRQLLASQAQQVGDVAVGAAAVAQMLDTDELICQEREALKRMQENLREQLRQAEIDMSMERAKLARERTELDEKLRSLEAERANGGPSAADGSGDKSKKPAGRKWLARLGLGETEGA